MGPLAGGDRLKLQSAVIAGELVELLSDPTVLGHDIQATALFLLSQLGFDTRPRLQEAITCGLIIPPYLAEAMEYVTMDFYAHLQKQTASKAARHMDAVLTGS